MTPDRRARAENAALDGSPPMGSKGTRGLLEQPVLILSILLCVAALVVLGLHVWLAVEDFSDAVVAGMGVLGVLALGLVVARQRRISQELERRVQQRTATLAEVNKSLAGEVEQRRAAADSLRRAHADLEIRVQERTAELARTNVSLHAEIADRRRAEEKYRSIFDNAVEGIFQSTPQGCFLEVNPTMARMHGYASPEELIASIQDIAHQLYVEPDRRTEYSQLLATQGFVRGFECQFLRKDGSKIWVSLCTRAVSDASGNVLYYEGTVEEITERKRLEEQFRQSQKMEAIGRLAGGVAHDFNNLLTVVMGYSDMLLESLPRGDPARAFISEIRQSGERAASLTQRLLAFSRKQVLRPTLINLNTVVTGMQKMLGRLLGSDVTLSTALRAQPGLVKADLSQLEQVLMNLAVNARDAMPEGGRLVLETSNVDLDAASVQHRPAVQPGRYVMLSVGDTGCGMDAATQARLFEPFFTTKEVGQGTGLGLATVYGIITQSGGHISVDSEPGRGTTFKLFLPRVDEPSPDAAPAAASARPLQGHEIILLVEDDDSVRALTLQVLQRYGYTVFEARDPAHALQLCEDYHGALHLLLTDMVMPEMNGRQLAERLLQQRPDLRVLYMSGYTESTVLRTQLSDDGVAFLHKPFTPETLALMVRKVLDA